MRMVHIGDIVQHFKRETLSEKEKECNKYLYIVRDIAEHTETGEVLVIYQALYAPFKTYARPAEMFCEEIDTDKYKEILKHYDIDQRHRFMKNEIKPTIYLVTD